ncbi:MAG: hypothetical protein Hals2KO_25750 [Halioglobus sp.]
MNTPKKFLTCLGLVTCVALVGCGRKMSPEEAAYRLEPLAPSLGSCEEGAQNCAQVMDCRDDKQPCLQRKISVDVDACAKSDDRDKCQNLADRLPEVSLVSDPYNLVSATFTTEPPEVELFSDDLRLPWDLEFLPDGTMLITEKKGRVVAMDASGKALTALQVSVIDTHEAGLMGLAIDPDFNSNRYVYLAYTYKLDDTDPAFAKPEQWNFQRVLNKIERWELNDGLLENPLVLKDDIPGSIEHTGMRLEFGPDGKLYASTGDANTDVLSQDIAFLGGKVLRMNPDGTVPDDNPIPGSYVYSRGHRNPQGLAWHPESGDLYTAEHGANRFDEINRIKPGANYGWGSYECHRSLNVKPLSDTVEFPLLCFPTWNLSPSGSTFVNDKNSPWHGNFFVAGLRGRHLHRYAFDGDSVTLDEIFYVSDKWDYSLPGRKGKVGRRLRDVEYHAGALYVIGDKFGLVKLTPGKAQQ